MRILSFVLCFFPHWHEISPFGFGSDERAFPFRFSCLYPKMETCVFMIYSALNCTLTAPLFPTEKPDVEASDSHKIRCLTIHALHVQFSKT